MIPKIKLRQKLLKIRDSLSAERRKEASLLLWKRLELQLGHALHPRSRVLSFFPIHSEIDVGPFNAFLAQQGLLLLPRREGEFLMPHLVTDPLSQLQETPFGLREPNPALCPRLSFDSIDFILVPGLGFDREGYRIGYGKGYYDRFLSQSKAHSIGVGFQEQAVVEPLPRDPWDLSVKELILV